MAVLMGEVERGGRVEVSQMMTEDWRNEEVRLLINVLVFAQRSVDKQARVD